MATADQWDRNYQTDDASHISISPVTSHLVRRRFELYRSLFASAPGKDLLEVGCAPGDWLVVLAKEFGLRPTGIDFAPTGCATARAKLAAHGIDGEVIEADFLSWEPATATAFDVIFFQGSLEHFPDCAAGLRRALRVLRPGGVMAAQIPCLAPWHINGLINRLLDAESLSDHYTRDLAAMEEAYRSVGLVDVTSVRFGSFQLILNEHPDRSPMFQAARRVVALADRLATTLLDRTDLRFDVPFLSPHVLTWGRRP